MDQGGLILEITKMILHLTETNLNLSDDIKRLPLEIANLKDRVLKIEKDISELYSMRKIVF